jgi:cardiolipin synthase A/B
MIPENLIYEIDHLIRRAHAPWLEAVCAVLCSVAASIEATALIAVLPPTNNSDAYHNLTGVVRAASGKLTWKELGSSIRVSAFLFQRWKEEQSVELLWTGPSPASQIPARRIDQVLYDLIDSARREILLVTYAAHRIERLTNGLVSALDRGVGVRLILEFEATSAGQLSMDAVRAFPRALRERAEIYYWPLEKRSRNERGYPGKLHAKVALVDHHAVLTSANLTDDAFTRNLEVGVLLSGGEAVVGLRAYFDDLCVHGTMKPWLS